MFRKPILYFELAARWYVFLMLTIYGIGKLMGGQFYRRGFLPPHLTNKALADVSGFELAWTFMGYSSTYVAFVGIAQIVGGVLLLFRQTKLFGIAILIPVLLNIVVFDVAFDIPAGALASASLYLSLLFFVIYANWHKVHRIVREMWSPLPIEKSPWRQRLVFAGIVTLLVVVLRGIDQFMMNYLGQ